MNPVKHFTLKRKPKSNNLRAELLQKSSDAQSSLKKTTAPTIPLRSRGMPRKMTDTTPLKGIPSRVPVAGFRSPNTTQNPSRPNLIRTPGGRKDGGIKIIEMSEQPLGFAAAKKRKRQQELEEQQKKAEQKQQSSNSSNAASINSSTTNTTEVSPIITDYSPSVYSTATIKEEIQDEKPPSDVLSNSLITSSTPISTTSIINTNKKFIKEEPFVVPKKEKEDEDKIDSIVLTKSSSLPLNIKQIKSEKANSSVVLKSNDTGKIMTITTSETIKSNTKEQRTADPLINLPNNISVKITPTKQSLSQNTATLSSGSNLILKQTTPTTIKTIPLSNQMKTGTGGPVIISQTIIQPATSKSANTSSSSGFVIPSNASIIRTTTAGGQSKIILAHSSQSNTVPSLTSLSQQSPPQTKIILKTSSGGLQPLMVTSRQPSSSNQVNQPPPLISTNLGNRAVTIQPASQAAQQQHLLLQQQQQKQQEQNFTQVVMTSPNNNTTGKGKTLYIPQKGIVLQNIGGDMYKQIPISNVSNLQTLTATSSNPPSLVQSLTTSANKSQQIPALIPSSSLPVVIQQQPQAVQTIISAVSII